MEGFTELFFTENKPGSAKKIKEGTMSLTYNPKSKTYAITFCQKTSKEIKDKGFIYARFFKNDVDGNISIVLNKDRGLMLSNTNNENSRYNITIRNKDLVETLGKKLGLSFDKNKGNYAIFSISDNISRNSSVMSFLIKNDKPIFRQVILKERKRRVMLTPRQERGNEQSESADVS